jgi:hypothetical protein
MRYSMQLSLIAIVVMGCGGASQMQRVADARWQAVPASERSEVDDARGRELARAQDDVKRAATQLEDARRAGAATTPAMAAPADAAHAQALAQVGRARRAWLDAGLAWRARRLEAARDHVVAIECQRELERAERVYARMHDDDAFDTGDFRSQHGRAQERWMVAEARAAEARADLDRDSLALMSAKDAYGQLARDAQQAAFADRRAAPLVGW